MNKHERRKEAAAQICARRRWRWRLPPAQLWPLAVILAVLIGGCLLSCANLRPENCQATVQVQPQEQYDQPLGPTEPPVQTEDENAPVTLPDPKTATANLASGFGVASKMFMGLAVLSGLGAIAAGFFAKAYVKSLVASVAGAAALAALFAWMQRTTLKHGEWLSDALFIIVMIVIAGAIAMFAAPVYAWLKDRRDKILRDTLKEKGHFVEAAAVEIERRKAKTKDERRAILKEVARQ